MNKIQYQEFLEKSRQYLEAMQSGCEQKYHLSQFDRMDYEQETGTMIFSSTGRLNRVLVEYQIVGSLSERSNTWLWSWDNPYLLENTYRDIWKVKDFGEKNEIEKLCTPKWEASVREAWDMTAVAAKLLKARGSYSFMSDDIRVFIIFKFMKITGKP